jgi:type 1 glutamine amidotransferase
MPHGLPQTDKIAVAVIVGGHNYDVPGFQSLLGSFSDEIESYVQSLENFVADAGKVRHAYDAILFYNMPKEIPTGKERLWLEQLGETAQGIVLLHHALVAYKEWDAWSELVGVGDRHIEYHHDETMRITVADPAHPIVEGLTGWEMIDETYRMPEPDAQSRVLLTTDHPLSMRAIAWTRPFRQTRLFCFQSGHDNQTWADPNFRTVLRRGLLWSAGRGA